MPLLQHMAVRDGIPVLMPSSQVYAMDLDYLDSCPNLTMTKIKEWITSKNLSFKDGYEDRYLRMDWGVVHFHHLLLMRRLGVSYEDLVDELNEWARSLES